MKTRIDDGGRAFPCGENLEFQQDGDDTLYRYGDTRGMSLRDYFAAAAMSSCIPLAAQFLMSDPEFKPKARTTSETLSKIMADASAFAWIAADAMIEGGKR